MNNDTWPFGPLERFKQLGMYAVTLYYGEDIGCDDSTEAPAERRVKLLGHPVGCLGEVRLMWVGTVAELLQANFKIKPQLTTNPPAKNIFDVEHGYYIWGTASSVESILERPFFGAWETPEEH